MIIARYNYEVVILACLELGGLEKQRGGSLRSAHSRGNTDLERTGKGLENCSVLPLDNYQRFVGTVTALL